MLYNNIHIHIAIFIKNIWTSELQIRGGIEDNSKIIFLIFQQKKTIYIVNPH